MAYGSATLRCKIWSLPFLGLRQGGGHGGLRSNFAIWQPWPQERGMPPRGGLDDDEEEAEQVSNELEQVNTSPF